MEYRIVVESSSADVSDDRLDHWSEFLGDFDLGFSVDDSRARFTFLLLAVSLRQAVLSACAIVELLNGTAPLSLEVCESEHWQRKSVLPAPARVLTADQVGRLLGRTTDQGEALWWDGLIVGRRMHGDLVFHIADVEIFQSMFPPPD